LFGVILPMPVADHVGGGDSFWAALWYGYSSNVARSIAIRRQCRSRALCAMSPHAALW